MYVDLKRIDYFYNLRTSQRSKPPPFNQNTAPRANKSERNPLQFSATPSYFNESEMRKVEVGVEDMKYNQIFTKRWDTPPTTSPRKSLCILFSLLASFLFKWNLAQFRIYGRLHIQRSTLLHAHFGQVALKKRIPDANVGFESTQLHYCDTIRPCIQTVDP